MADTKEEKQTKQFAKATRIQHPDTREVHVFEKDEDVPDWALTVLTGRAFKGAEADSELNLGPVPGFGSRKAADDDEDASPRRRRKAADESTPSSGSPE